MNSWAHFCLPHLSIFQCVVGKFWLWQRSLQAPEIQYFYLNFIYALAFVACASASLRILHFLLLLQLRAHISSEICNFYWQWLAISFRTIGNVSWPTELRLAQFIYQIFGEWPTNLYFLPIILWFEPKTMYWSLWFNFGQV